MGSDVKRSRLSRAESQAATRERLLAAARTEVVKQGFGGASVRDIAEAAGFSQGAFYSNFESKEDLLLALLAQHMDEEADRLGVVIGIAEEQGPDVMAGFDAWAAELNSDVDWSMLGLELQLHANRSASFASSYRTVRAKHRQRLGDLVARFFAALGLAPPAPSQQLASAFMAMAHGLALERDHDAEAPAGRLIVTFLKGLIASATPLSHKETRA
jgi:AcrR family transcriptional regulator